MSDERTHVPTKRRRQLAREHGQVAFSPELTGAVGLLGAIVLLGSIGADLALRLTTLMRASFTNDPEFAIDATNVSRLIFDSCATVFAPLALLLIGVVAVLVLSHQLQVGGLLAPALLAPDFARLWKLGSPDEMTTRAANGARSLLKVAAILGVCSWSIWLDAPAHARWGMMDARGLLSEVGRLVISTSYRLACVLLGLGIIEFALRYRSLENALRQSREEQREDQKAIDGDPAVRRRRLQTARAAFANPAEALAGASLVVTAPGGLTVVLGGGPPPRKRVLIRASARGLAGWTLRRHADRFGLRCVESARLARRLSQPAMRTERMSPDDCAELEQLWTIAATRPDANNS